MTNQWFRSWHGAPTDPKWLGIARKGGVAPGIVAALVWALLDRASQANERGSIAGYDADGLGCFFGCEPEQVVAVIAALHDKGVLQDNAFSGWEKHQPKREDGAAERAKEWRERKRTQANAAEPEQTLDTDTDTDTEKESSLSVTKPTRAKKTYPDDFEAFWKGYPTDPLMSKKEAGAAWAKLTADDRTAVISALPAFNAHCRKTPDYRVLHACRFISQRRFEGFSADATGPPAGIRAVHDRKKSLEELIEETGWIPGPKYASTG